MGFNKSRGISRGVIEVWAVFTEQIKLETVFLGDYPEEHNLIASTSIVLVKYHRTFTKQNIISLSDWPDKINMIIKSGWSSLQDHLFRYHPSFLHCWNQKEEMLNHCLLFIYLFYDKLAEVTHYINLKSQGQ